HVTGVQTCALPISWPWYVAGAVIGLTVPALLLLGNKHLGISSSLRHICSACVPSKIPFFKYDWKREAWNLFFVAGILIGGIVGTRRSEEHTSELQSRENLVCRLLLEKKKDDHKSLRRRTAPAAART